MDARSMLLAAFASAFQQSNRLFSLHFTDALLDGELLPHILQGEEHISEPYTLRIECLSTDVTLALKTLVGLGVDIVIHGEHERMLSGIVTQAEQIGADGGFVRYTLQVEPALAVLKLRRNSRVFQDKTVVDIVHLILDEHIAGNSVFSACFRYRDQLTETYPSRSFCQQYRESDLAFIERLLREEGISYTFDFAHGDDEVGVHTLVLFDAGTELSAAAQSTIRFHRADTTEADDTFTEWRAQRQIRSGSVSLASFDYKGVYTQRGSGSSAVDHGESGGGLISSLEDYDPQSLYYGADNTELARYATLRQQAIDLRAKVFTGTGVVRGLGAGQTFTLTEHPDHEQDDVADRQFAVLRQQFSARNNLPGDFDALTVTVPSEHSALVEPGYRNTVDVVRQSIPIVPAFSHTSHSKPSARGMQTATVTGPAGEEIYTDELGRIKIQFHWARPQDHDTGQHGASADKNDFSSCWVRVAYPSAGASWGHQFIPRVGQEVLVEFIEGDIDRPLVIGALYNGQHDAPRFSDEGSLPANKTLSGIKSKEYKGNRYNELVFDDTTGEIRTKLSSEHGKTQLNQGYLIHPRTEGKGEPRGEGFELRTDNAGALRAAQGLLLTTEPQPNAGGNTLKGTSQLDRSSVQAQLDAAADLADSLGATAKAQKANQPETGKGNQTVNVDFQTGSNKTSGHLHHLKEATANLERNTNTDPDAKSGPDPKVDQAGQQPLLILSGQNGIAFTTPQSATLASGSNLDHIAQRDAHQTTGKRWIHNAGESISLFVAGAQSKVKDTLKLLAGKGDMQIQAQSGEIEITADKNIRLYAVKQNQTWSAQKEILLTAGGAYVRIGGGNIELHCPGTLTFKGSQHAVTGPMGMPSVLPNLPQVQHQKNFMELSYHDDALAPIAGAPYIVVFEDGTRREGKLDGNGHARLDGVPPGTARVYYGEHPAAPTARVAMPANTYQSGAATQEEALAKLERYAAESANFWQTQATREQKDMRALLNEATTDDSSESAWHYLDEAKQRELMEKLQGGRV